VIAALAQSELELQDQIAVLTAERDENPTLDLNAVRPRLTELEAERRVTKGEKRRCGVTWKRVYTRVVVSPPTVPVPFIEQARTAGARQMGLL
jgi:hypothetical protein